VPGKKKNGGREGGSLNYILWKKKRSLLVCPSGGKERFEEKGERVRLTKKKRLPIIVQGTRINKGE